MGVNLTPTTVKQVIRLEDLLIRNYRIKLIFVLEGEPPQLEEINRN